MKRQGTKYSGVYSLDGKQGKTFYIRYRLAGKAIDEKAGRVSDGMTASKAAKIRIARLSGKELSNREQREKAKQRLSVYTIEKIWAEYQISKGAYKSMNFENSNFKHIASLAKKTPDGITNQDIDRIRKSLADRSSQTVKHVLSLLTRLVNFGVRSGFCQPLSCSIQYPRINNIKDDSLNAAQIQSLLFAIEADSNQTVGNIMKLALATGMRKSEILGLKWEDVNFLTNHISLKNTKSGHDKIIPLNEAARAIFEGMKITSRQAYVFPGREGKKRIDITRAARKIMRAANIPDTIRPLHSLRHTFASQLASAGVDMYVLQQLMTHSSQAMTARYAHLADQVLQEGSEKIVQIIKTA